MIPTISVAPTFTGWTPLEGMVTLLYWGGSDIQLVTVIVPELPEFVRVVGADGNWIEMSAFGSPVTKKLPGLCVPPITFTVPLADLVPCGVNIICPPAVSGEN